MNHNDFEDWTLDELTTIGCIGIDVEFCTDIHIPHRRNCSEFSDPLLNIWSKHLYLLNTS